MNRLQVPVVVVAAVAAMVLVATRGDSRADQLPSGEQSLQWEYKVEPCSFHSGTEAQLNEMGSKGWELVQITDGMGVFRRMKSSPGRSLQTDVQTELLEDTGVIILRGKEEDVKSAVGLIRQIEPVRPKSARSETSGVHGEKKQPARKKQEQVESRHVQTKYESMEKNDLQEELRRLQKEALDAARMAQQVKEEAAEAATAYKSASEDEKADSLLRMIESEAKSHRPMRHYRQVQSAFEAAQRVYLHLLMVE